MRAFSNVVSISPAKQSTGRTFEGEEFYIPLRREEAVVQKEARVREEVRVRKETQSERQQVSEQVRREDVEIETSGDARKTGTRPGSAEEIREREERPRSQRRRDE